MIHKTMRSILSVLLAALLLVTSIPLTPAFADGGGAVSLQSANNESRELKPAGDGKYYISTAEQLKDFAKLVNEDGKTTANAILTDDIDLNPGFTFKEDGSYSGPDEEEPHQWTPIGSDSRRYSGTFNGDGHTISGLYIDSSDNDYQGLFGYLSTDGGNIGTVKDLSVSGSVSGDWYVGGVVGRNFSGTVTGCTFSGSVSGNIYVGGVVGYNGGTVENCYNTGSVSGNSVGGVVGYNSGTVENCYNTGSVSGETTVNVGGVVGYNHSDGSVTNSYNTGAVSGGEEVGGVVGQNFGNGIVTGCYFLQTNELNNGLNGIGGDSSNTNATPVDDLPELCKKFESVTGWTTSPFCEHPVLKTNPEGGLGTATHPYEIKTAAQLETFRDIVNGANRQEKDSDAHAKLMNDINLSSVCGESNSWTPIGNSEENAYTGTFNGDGHTISGLYIKNTTNDYYQGLFGYVGGFVGSEGTVQNLSVSGTVSGGICVGGVVGYNYSGIVTGCTFSGSGSVSGGSYVGGIVGYNGTGATVSNCYNTGTVSDNNMYVGGVVGVNRGTVENCYNIGEVSGGEDVGGVVGYNSGGDGGIDIVTGCYFLKTADVNSKLQGIGNDEDTEGATEKDDTAFHSGEVAYLLQSKQPAAEDGTIPQVWGQSKLGETTSWPTLNPTDEQKVYQVTFDYGTSFTDNDDRYDYRYANANDNVTLPTSTDPIPSYEGHTLTGWQDKDGTQVTEPITVTADTTFTAQWTKDTVNYTVSVSADPEAGGTVSGSGEYSEGTQVTVTATPATGYHFVNWTENGTEVSTGATFTFNATVDRNLIAIFAKNEDPTPTPTPDPTPSGPSTGDSSGWDDILDELENTAKGDEITIDMGDETKVPAEIFESLAGKDVDVTFDLGDIQWTVNGADIPTDTDFTDLDLGVNLDTSGIPVNVINTITGEVGTVQITLAHDGEFGFTMTLTAPLGKENAGYWANLYHYKVNGGEADREDPLGDDEDAEALNFEAAAKIDEDGSVTIPFSHASQYAIVIDTHSHATVDVSDLFIDVARDAWYKDAVQYAYDNGLMTGVSDTEFAPEATTTRAMIVSILARLEGVESAEAAGFADVDDNDWYATAVNWAANVGVVNGYEDNTFRPNTAITREQLAAILMNYAAYKGEDVSNRADLTSYTDQPSTWAQEAISWSVAEGLLTGVTADTLQPQGAATRAQVAAILQRFLSE